MQEFAIAPAGLKPLGFVLPIGLVMLGIFSLFAVSVIAANGARFQITSEGLRLRGDLYGRFIPVSNLRLDGARRVDLSRATELAPRRRTMGATYPGFRAGWFRLANGEKALLYLTDGQKAVYIPTTEGYSLLLSPDDPDAFLAALKAGPGSRVP
jgi:hypothetical protein